MPNLNNRLSATQCLHRGAQALVAIATLVASVSSFAQRCGSGCGNPEALLGLSERTLIALYPDLRRNNPTVKGPGNMQGRWSLSDVPLGNQNFDSIIFIAEGRVARVEFISTATASECRNRSIFSNAKEQLVQRYGESQASATYEVSGRSVQTLSFADEATDATLNLTESPNTCETRVVFKPHLAKDASTL